MVEAVGKDVTKFKPGDQVIADQVLNCHSKGRAPLCEYCETGDSHQCAFLEELGITGLPGAFAELLSLPETNVLLLPHEMPLTKGAIVEPLACVLHASDRMERSRNRYDFEGRYPHPQYPDHRRRPQRPPVYSISPQHQAIRWPDFCGRHAGEQIGPGGEAGRHAAGRAGGRFGFRDQEAHERGTDPLLDRGIRRRANF